MFSLYSWFTLKLNMQSRANKWRKFSKDIKFLPKTKRTLEDLASSLQLD